MKKLKIAVIGVGHLGKFHAQKYKLIPTVELVAVSDIDQSQCNLVANELQTSAVTDFRKLLNLVDAVSIVTPTLTHYPIAKFFLEAGIHVLLEKPITETLDQADDLIRTASKNHLIFQIGHIERFNPAVRKLESIIRRPRLIEAVRSGPFQPRNLDVSVILDLMIHDIDIIQTMHKAPIKQIEATGLSMMSDLYDVVNARLIFEDGCVANLTANRMAPKKERTLKVYQSDSHIFVDFQEQTLLTHPHISDYSIQKIDTLLAQIEAFILSIRMNLKPMVSGQEGKEALKVALAISSAIEREKVFAE